MTLLMMLLGSILGAWVRFTLYFVTDHFVRSYYITALVNFFACFVLALTWKLGLSSSLLMTFLLAATATLSTFSSYIVEIYQEWKKGEYVTFFMIVILNHLLGAFGFFLGYVV